jgi:hypothetical protein
MLINRESTTTSKYIAERTSSVANLTNDQRQGGNPMPSKLSSYSTQMLTFYEDDILASLSSRYSLHSTLYFTLLLVTLNSSLSIPGIHLAAVSLNTSFSTPTIYLAVSCNSKLSPLYTEHSPSCFLLETHYSQLKALTLQLVQ